MAIVVACAVAPGAAFAQAAGDEQYRDPFPAGEEAASSSAKPTTAQPAQATTTEGQLTDTPPRSTPTPAPTATAADDAETNDAKDAKDADKAELAATGSDAWAIGLGGFALLLLGGSLRFRAGRSS